MNRRIFNTLFTALFGGWLAGARPRSETRRSHGPRPSIATSVDPSAACLCPTCGWGSPLSAEQVNYIRQMGKVRDLNDVAWKCEACWDAIDVHGIATKDFRRGEVVGHSLSQKVILQSTGYNSYTWSKVALVPGELSGPDIMPVDERSNELGVILQDTKKDRACVIRVKGKAWVNRDDDGALGFYEEGDGCGDAVMLWGFSMAQGFNNPRHVGTCIDGGWVDWDGSVDDYKITNHPNWVDYPVRVP